MGFRGYHQILCAQGHLSCTDAYEFLDAKNWICPICNEKMAWWALVDETNGVDEKTGECPGFVNLTVKEPAKQCTCKTCGHIHHTTKPIYIIPEKEGHKVDS